MAIGQYYLICQSCHIQVTKKGFQLAFAPSMYLFENSCKSIIFPLMRESNEAASLRVVQKYQTFDLKNAWLLIQFDSIKGATKKKFKFLDSCLRVPQDRYFFAKNTKDFQNL